MITFLQKVIIIMTTSCATCSAAATICPRPLQVVTFNSHSERSSWRSSHMSMWVIVLHSYIPSLKFVGLLVPKIWLIFGHGIYQSGDLDLWPFDLGTAVCNVTRGTDNLPANFEACATFLCGVTGERASDGRRDVITLTSDSWGHCACRWCGSSYSIPVPSLKFV